MSRLRKVFFALEFLAIVYGYSAECQDLRYGIKAGINVSDFSVRTNAFGDGIQNLWKPIMLSHIGGFIEKPLNNNLNLQIELIYAINGSNLQSFKQYAHYLSIPLILNYRPYKRIAFEFGPQGSFVYKSRKSFLLIDTNIDLGVIAGCRYNITQVINVGLRYVQGLAPLSTLTAIDNNGSPRNIHDFYSRNLQFSVAYQFSKTFKHH